MKRIPSLCDTCKYAEEFENGFASRSVTREEKEKWGIDFFDANQRYCRKKVDRSYSLFWI